VDRGRLSTLCGARALRNDMTDAALALAPSSARCSLLVCHRRDSGADERFGRDLPFYAVTGTRDSRRRRRSLAWWVQTTPA
jgi:hypothetical protein